MDAMRTTSSAPARTATSASPLSAAPSSLEIWETISAIIATAGNWSGRARTRCSCVGQKSKQSGCMTYWWNGLMTRFHHSSHQKNYEMYLINVLPNNHINSISAAYWWILEANTNASNITARFIQSTLHNDWLCIFCKIFPTLANSMVLRNSNLIVYLC